MVVLGIYAPNVEVIANMELRYKNVKIYFHCNIELLSIDFSRTP